MVIGRAVTGLSVGRADAVAILRNFQGRPVVFRQSGDQACDYAGLADAARVSADDDEGHGLRTVVGHWSLVVGPSLTAIRRTNSFGFCQRPTTNGRRRFPTTILSSRGAPMSPA